jgi:hypothetical protein
MRFLKSCLLLFFLLQLLFRIEAQESMSLLDRRISCMIDTATVEQILEKVVNDNDLFFSYNPDILPKERISVHQPDVKLGDLIRIVLPEDVYKIEIIDNQVIITIKEVSPIRLSGIILEGKDESPVSYASISIAGESIGTRQENFSQLPGLQNYRLDTE